MIKRGPRFSVTSKQSDDSFESSDEDILKAIAQEELEISNEEKERICLTIKNNRFILNF